MSWAHQPSEQIGLISHNSSTFVKRSVVISYLLLVEPDWKQSQGNMQEVYIYF